tara:strand:- start:82504 stop:83259 length:756 start_codon:yes stop_codon:yes gene_type:complete
MKSLLSAVVLASFVGAPAFAAKTRTEVRPEKVEHARERIEAKYDAAQIAGKEALETSVKESIATSVARGEINIERLEDGVFSKSFDAYLTGIYGKNSARDNTQTVESALKESFEKLDEAKEEAKGNSEKEQTAEFAEAVALEIMNIISASKNATNKNSKLSDKAIEDHARVLRLLTFHTAEMTRGAQEDLPKLREFINAVRNEIGTDPVDGILEAATRAAAETLFTDAQIKEQGLDALVKEFVRNLKKLCA